METTEKKITLNYNRKDLEEVYFNNKKGNIFLSPFVIREFKTFLVFLTALIAVIVYVIVTNHYPWTIIPASIAALVFFFPYYASLAKLIKWRNSVLAFLNITDQFKHHILILSENSLTLQQDDKEEISRWSAFSNAEISEKYVLLIGKVHFIFPKKSMQPEEYEYLCDYIKAHLKNGL